MLAGPAATSDRTATVALANPSTVATAVTSADSAKNRNTRRARLAPNAWSTAISRCRASARTNVRFATLAQATSNTSSAAAATIQRVPAIEPVISALRGTSTGFGCICSNIARVEMPVTKFGNSSGSRWSTDEKSRSTSAIVTLGLRRATPK